MFFFHTLILPRPTQARNSGRAKQCWIARCDWRPPRFQLVTSITAQTNAATIPVAAVPSTTSTVRPALNP